MGQPPRGGSRHPLYGALACQALFQCLRPFIAVEPGEARLGALECRATVVHSVGSAGIHTMTSFASSARLRGGSNPCQITASKPGIMRADATSDAWVTAAATAGAKLEKAACFCYSLSGRTSCVYEGGARSGNRPPRFDQRFTRERHAHCGGVRRAAVGQCPIPERTIFLKLRELLHQLDCGGRERCLLWRGSSPLLPAALVG